VHAISERFRDESLVISAVQIYVYFALLYDIAYLVRVHPFEQYHLTHLYRQLDL